MFFDLLVQMINFLSHILDLVSEILIKFCEGDFLLADQGVDVLQLFYFFLMCLHLGF